MEKVLNLICNDEYFLTQKALISVLQTSGFEYQSVKKSALKVVKKFESLVDLSILLKNIVDFSSSGYDIG